MATIETSSQPHVKVRETNATDATFPSRVPTATKPSGAGVLVFAQFETGVVSPNGLVLVPFGVGADNNTFKVRVIGWRKVGQGSLALWVPVTLAELTCTLSAAVGVDNTAVASTNRFADTITVGVGNTGVSVDAVSPANDTIASALIDGKGCQLIEVVFDMNSSATSANALAAKV